MTAAIWNSWQTEQNGYSYARGAGLNRYGLLKALGPVENMGKGHNEILGMSLDYS